MPIWLLLRIIMIIALVQISLSFAHAQPAEQDCLQIALQKTIDASDWSLDKKFSYLMTLDEGKYSEMKANRSISLGVTGFGDAAAKSENAAQFREILRQTYHLTTSEIQNRSNYTEFFSDNTLKMYTECLHQKQAWAFYLQSRTDTSAKIKFIWSPQPPFQQTSIPIVVHYDKALSKPSSATTNRIGALQKGISGTGNFDFDFTVNRCESPTVSISIGSKIDRSIEIPKFITTSKYKRSPLPPLTADLKTIIYRYGDSDPPPVCFTRENASDWFIDPEASAQTIDWNKEEMLQKYQNNRQVPLFDIKMLFDQKNSS